MKSPDPDREERIRRIEERLAKGIPDAKPKPVAVLTVPITDKLAEAIRANPASLRLSARGVDGIALIGGAVSNAHEITPQVNWMRKT